MPPGISLASLFLIRSNVFPKLVFQGIAGRMEEKWTEEQGTKRRHTFEMTSAVSAKVEHLCNPVLAKKSSINLVPILYPLKSAQARILPLTL